ncbi:hypothetical protein EV421DRAFT_1719649 [Armillaria borealis]|uniref:Uncharacterized protein n=1 Tax=Armillaria borealis TaxID=47425 RepID=A0AA39IYX5_9AGAR|nr:hypothetical protein EV421DRAFT_1719649 [Armillaria borealis]
MIPPSTSTVVVKALNVGQLKCLLASLFFTPVVEGHEFFSGPIYAFLVEHPTKGCLCITRGF